MADATPTPYDQVPYESQAFVETHPNRLATLAILQGLDPPAVASARVLELGCADGGNLIPMALATPGGRFVGVDLSPRQIAEGRDVVARLGLSNIELQAQDLREIGPDLGTFDYIVCHGVYSWVPLEVREHLLAICSRNLSPNGVAYVSYNTFPGWHGLRMIREQMLFHGEGFSDPLQRASEVRAFLDELVATLPDGSTPYAQLLNREVSQFRSKTDSYLLHEFLEAVNEPVYFHEFVSSAGRHGLKYISDARMKVAAESQPAPVRAFLDRFAGEDPIRREQYLDFLRNRSFRRSLLVQGDQRPAPPAADRLERLRILAVAGTSSPSADIHTAAPVEFTAPDGVLRLTTNNPIVKMALVILCESWPRSVPVPELRARTLTALERPPSPAAAAPFTREPAAMNEALLQCFAGGLVELHSEEPPFATDLSECPKASPYAVMQADRGGLVTNLRHRMVELGGFDRLLIRLLDGTRGRDELVDSLVAAVFDGRFPLSRDGQPITDAIEVRQILDRSLDPALFRLRGSSLLVG